MRHFRGTFNWQGEIHTLTTVAYGEGTAYTKFTRVLAKKLSRTPNAVRAYFGGQRDNYTITQIVGEENTNEWKEQEARSRRQSRE